MQKSLKISPAPFKPSRLSIPPSPFSPRSPFTPVAPHRYQTQNTSRQGSAATSRTEVYAPLSPLKWTWTCHQCRHSYRLGVTRRCLEDGHYYCSGQVTLKAWRKPTNARRSRKRGACSSEFDYSGWKEWSRWRRGGPRDEAALRSDSPIDNQGEVLEQKKKDCWNICDYPSECKWGKRFGIHTPVQTCFPVPEVNTMPTLNTSVETTSGILSNREAYQGTMTSDEDETMSLWTALLVSAERRKNSGRCASSPLSAITEKHSETGRDSSIVSPLQESKDDATKAASQSPISDESTALQPSNSSAASTVPKPLLSRTRYRRGNSTSTMHTSKKTKQTRAISTSDLGQQVILSTSETVRDWPELTRMPSRQACFV